MKKTLFMLEIKKQLKNSFFWFVGLSFYVVLIILLFPVFEGELANMLETIEGNPLFDFFGANHLQIDELIGFYGMEAGMILLLGTGIFAGILGGTILAKEIKEGTIEYLSSQPISRKKMYIVKGSTVIFNIILVNFFLVILILGALLYVDPNIEILRVLFFHFMLVIFQIQIALLAFSISTLTKKPFTSIGVIIAVGGYFLYTILNILERDIFDFIMLFLPFRYADPILILSGLENFKWVSLLIGFIITMATIFISYCNFKTKDLV